MNKKYSDYFCDELIKTFELSIKKNEMITIDFIKEHLKNCSICTTTVNITTKKVLDLYKIPESFINIFLSNFIKG